MVLGIPRATKENKYTKIEKREAKSQELRTWLSHLQTDESINSILQQHRRGHHLRTDESKINLTAKMGGNLQSC